ncbi:AAA family ATPase [Leptospira alstonii]|nr:AAA family ATPase [Leptospira alstonii]
MTLSKILRILFPEIQMYDFVKEHGFIVKRKETVSPQTLYGSGTPQSASSSNSNSSLSSRNHQNQSPLDEKFSTVYYGITATILEQEKFAQALTGAFKLPYLNPSERQGKTWNTILVAGPPGTGKKKALAQVAYFLWKAKLISSESPIELDLAKYSERNIHTHFILDISNAFSKEKGIVCFSNWERAHSQIQEHLVELLENGFFRTDQGVKIQAENYYVVLYLDKGPKEKGPYESIPQSMIDFIPAAFRKHLRSFAISSPLSETSLQKIFQTKLEEARMDLRVAIQIQTNYEPTFVNEMVSYLEKGNRGGESIEEWVKQSFQEKIQSLVATDTLARGSAISLFIKDGQPFARNDAQEWLLKPTYSTQVETVEDVLAELNKLVGLESVKKEINRLVSLTSQRREREAHGQSVGPLTLHLSFTGNPGTGKTTVARLIGRLYKAMGLLKEGHTVECARQDLVAGYVGHTAPQTMAKVKEAMGGILFIDEAYALIQDKHDSFGKEALDTLLKAMEDNRTDLAVVVAGYTNEMSQFMDANPGMRSRIPNVIEFPDYTPAEMLSILKLQCGKDFAIPSESDRGLLELFEMKQIPGRNDSGNGRLVRNLFDEARKRQGDRLSKISSATAEDYKTLLPEDFGIGKKETFNLEAAFAGIVGLEKIKTFVRSLENQVRLEKIRKDAGLGGDSGQRLNMVFSGNPGTGKTTVARLLAQMLKEIGVLKKGHLVEVTRKDLVAEYVGQTAGQTAKVVQDAIGGVLFIDEAYQLAEDSNGGFGKEAVDTLIREMENHKDNLVVILAGYTQEMENLIKVNPGLRSRIPINIEFSDYSPEEMVLITEINAKKKGFAIEGEVIQRLPKFFAERQVAGKNESGNGRLVDNLVDSARRRQSERIMNSWAKENKNSKSLSEQDKKELNTLTLIDFEIEKPSDGKDALSQLNAIIGLDNVKTFVREISAQVEIAKLRGNMGITSGGRQSLHMVFLGNPGTGKTTIARILAKRLNEIGVIPGSTVVETDRAGLVAGYVGQTAIKTSEKIRQALGGVLFIDEAYALARGGQNDFGREAIDTIVKAMEDHRENLIIILAGYSADMENFLNTNEGLRSRFPNLITFPDYSLEELIAIGKSMLKSKGYVLSTGAEQKLIAVLKSKISEKDFGNARGVRNAVEKTERTFSNRLISLQQSGQVLTKEILTTVQPEDLEGI